MRVHLSGWEWDCCGEPFRVGDEVELQVTSPGAWVLDTYGELGRSVDRHETHHEVNADDAPTEAVRGRVRFIRAIYLAHSVHHEPRSAEQLAELEKLRAAEAAERAELAARSGAGEVVLTWGFGPVKPYTVRMEPIPGAVRTVPIDGIPAASSDPAADAAVRAARDAAIAPDTPVEMFSGYLVDLDPA